MITSRLVLTTLAVSAALAGRCAAQQVVDPAHKYAWTENCGWTNWADGGASSATTEHPGIFAARTFLTGSLWGENFGWITVGHRPADGFQYANTTGLDYGVNIDPSGGLSGFAWGENVGWVNFAGGAAASPPIPARISRSSGLTRLVGYVWAENIGWINLDDAQAYIGLIGTCGSADFDGDGSIGTDADIEAFFACLGGSCCSTCGVADFNGDGDVGTDADIEAFFQVLMGGSC